MVCEPRTNTCPPNITLWMTNIGSAIVQCFYSFAQQSERSWTKANQLLYQSNLFNEPEERFENLIVVTLTATLKRCTNFIHENYSL